MSSLHPFGGRISRRFLPNSPDDAYLSYFDVRLTYRDVDSIKTNDWLTDNNISFWEEYIENSTLQHYSRANVVLLRPTMVFMLMHYGDVRALKSALPDFKKTTHIFLPINNAKDVDVPEAGSHWSLLVVSVIDGVAFHYDSLGNENRREAQDISVRLSILLEKPLRYAQMDYVPQQDNGNDCGIFVCMFMDTLLCDRLLKADAGERISMSLKDMPFDAKKFRKRMIDLIDSFRREGERRRSRSVSPYHPKTPPRIDS